MKYFRTRSYWQFRRHRPMSGRLAGAMYRATRKSRR